MTLPPLDPALDPHQKIVAIVVAVVVAAVVLELVRRHRLREEFSAIWLGTTVLLLGMALEPSLLSWFASVIGAKTATSALFFGALMFLMVLSLVLSVRLSRLTMRSKKLAQQNALADAEIEQLRAQLAELRRDAARPRSATKDDVA